MEKDYTIGVLIGNANSSYTRDLMQGIRREAQSLGVHLVFFLGIHSSYYYRSYFGEDTDDDYDYQFNTVYDYVDFSRLDALLISYGTLCIFLGEQEKTGFLERFRRLPCVYMEERDEKGESMSLINDNYQGMYALAEHLVRDHGYRKLTYLSGPEENTDARERKQAVLDVMKKYGVPFDESHIAYGDYSPCVEVEVQALFDRYPDMEAMICANDNMADTAYKEARKRGRKVGKDFAITGYDDSDQAANMDPPLTTVFQDPYDMGRMAVIGAMELCRKKKPRTIVIPSRLVLRQSCGCRPEREFHMESLDALLERLFPEKTDFEENGFFREKIRALFQLDFRKKEGKLQLKNDLKELRELDKGSGFYMNTIQQALDNYLDALLREELEKERADQTAVRNLISCKNAAHRLTMAALLLREQEESVKYQQESWFLPLISRDMICHMEEEEELYRRAMIKFAPLEARNSWLYIFPHPIVHHREDAWNCPEYMYLAARQEGRNVIAFPEKERPVIRRQGNFKETMTGWQVKKDGVSAACVFCLFSGETQYGVLVTEIDPSKISLFYLISRQIGNMLRLYESHKEQRRMQKELEFLVKAVREKNEVLNFISESDPLTSCLNRRGFMEKVMELNRKNAGRAALLFVADLDHLKEINDCFGHVEGDFAICQSARLLKEVIGEGGIVGRIGGDEFCALLPGEEENDERIREKLKRAGELFNQASGKDYYVELSLGCTTLVCDENLVFTELLKEADRGLYEAKKRRRSSVKKEK